MIIYKKGFVSSTIITETVSCGTLNGYHAKAPRCLLCQNAHEDNDSINNAWCDGDCWYDDGENKCTQIGKNQICFLLGNAPQQYQICSLESISLHTCIIAPGQYAQSAFGSDCNALGNVRLGSKQQCRAAAISLGKSFIRAKNDANHPTGCYFSHSRNTYWNFHKNGTKRSDFADICSFNAGMNHE